MKKLALAFIVIGMLAPAPARAVAGPSVCTATMVGVQPVGVPISRSCVLFASGSRVSYVSAAYTPFLIRVSRDRGRTWRTVVRFAGEKVLQGNTKSEIVTRRGWLVRADVYCWDMTTRKICDPMKNWLIGAVNGGSVTLSG